MEELNLKSGEQTQELTKIQRILKIIEAIRTGGMSLRQPVERGKTDNDSE